MMLWCTESSIVLSTSRLWRCSIWAWAVRETLWTYSFRNYSWTTKRALLKTILYTSSITATSTPSNVLPTPLATGTLKRIASFSRIDRGKLIASSSAIILSLLSKWVCRENLIFLLAWLEPKPNEPNATSTYESTQYWKHIPAVSI